AARHQLAPILGLDPLRVPPLVGDVAIAELAHGLFEEDVLLQHRRNPRVPAQDRGAGRRRELAGQPLIDRAEGLPDPLPPNPAVEVEPSVGALVQADALAPLATGGRGDYRG